MPTIDMDVRIIIIILSVLSFYIVTIAIVLYFQSSSHLFILSVAVWNNPIHIDVPFNYPSIIPAVVWAVVPVCVAAEEPPSCR